VDSWPAASAVAPVMPTTAAAGGLGRPTLVPSPSSPKWLSPAHRTAPPATVQQVWALPVVRWPPLDGAGNGFARGAQHSAAPDPKRPHVWMTDAAMS
jgi:hypothetical protein